jgi:CubicO group peptidase (beta-lactamase class C family)
MAAQAEGGEAEAGASVEEDIRLIAEPLLRFDSAVGIAIGVITADGQRRVVTLGLRENVPSNTPEDQRLPVTEDTVFEVGSITKVFTALLALDAAERGELVLDDPVNDYLPGEAKLGPGPDGEAVTIRQLMQHRAGLPPLPANIAASGATMEQPYAKYGNDALWDATAGFTLLDNEDAEAGAEGEASAPAKLPLTYAYSNFGYALLGQAVARAAGGSYEQLVSERILGPLGMTGSAFDLPRELADRRAVPHRLDREQTEMWAFDAFAPAGGLRSSAEDMLTFAQAMLNPRDAATEAGVTPIEAALRASLVGATERIAGSPNDLIGLGWHVRRLPQLGSTLYWHNGQTGGSRSFIGGMPDRDAAIVVLTNYPDAAVDGLAQRLVVYALTGEAEPAPVREFVEISAAQIDQVVGTYRFPDGREIEISREGRQVFAKVDDQPAYRIYPERLRWFFYKVVPAEITFIFDMETNRAGTLVFMQNGGELRAELVDGEEGEQQAPAGDPFGDDVFR